MRTHFPTRDSCEMNQAESLPTNDSYYRRTMIRTFYVFVLFSRMVLFRGYTIPSILRTILPTYNVLLCDSYATTRWLMNHTRHQQEPGSPNFPEVVNECLKLLRVRNASPGLLRDLISLVAAGHLSLWYPFVGYRREAICTCQSCRQNTHREQIIGHMTANRSTRSLSALDCKCIKNPLIVTYSPEPPLDTPFDAQHDAQVCQEKRNGHKRTARAPRKIVDS